MQLRLLCAAAFIARLRYREARRLVHRHIQRTTVREVIAYGATRGLAPGVSIQRWLMEKAVLLARIPRRPGILRREELESTSDEEESPSDS